MGTVARPGRAAARLRAHVAFASVAVTMMACDGGCEGCDPPPTLCESGVPAPFCDAGVPDVGPPDTGPMDTGPVDSGPVDAGPEDTGPADTGPEDMGEEDGGPSCDCPPRECRVVSCLDAICDYTVADDGTPCFGGAGSCVSGECVLDEDELCDETITVPRVIASRPLGTDVPSTARPSVGLDGDGLALFVWTAEVAGTLEVHGRRLAPDRQSLDCHDAPLVIETGIDLGWDASPTVAGLANGGWVVTWTSPTLDGDLGGIGYRLVASGGDVGPARVANEETLFHQHEPRVAALGDGFAIAWTDESGESPEDDLAGVHARLFGWEGRPLGRERVVPAATAGDQRQPALAVSGSTWLVAWTDVGESLDAVPVVRARRFDGLTALDAEDIVVFADHGASPSVTAPRSGGDFVVAWESRAVDARGDVHARAVVSGEDPLAGSTIVDVAVTGEGELLPAVAAGVEGAALVVWHEGFDQRDVRLAALGGSLPAGASAVAEHLSADGLERDASIVEGVGGVWIVWSDDGTVGELTAYRSVLAVFLEQEGSP